MTHRVVVFRKSDGQRFERWPLDAREMLNTGDYTDEQTLTAVDADPSPVSDSVELPPAAKNGQAMPNGVVIAIVDPLQAAAVSASPVHKRRR